MNIADFIDENAIKIPERKAIVAKVSHGIYEHYTFETLSKRANQYANYLTDLGIKKSQKVLLFMPPGLDFPVLVFALFKIGAVPIFMDPGMGKNNLLSSIEQCKPDVLMAIPLVHLIAKFKKRSFTSITKFIKIGKTFFGGETSFHKKARAYPHNFENIQMSKEEMGAILFTSGGTGKPKGVVYTQEIFKAQTLKLKEMFNLTPIDVDLPGFPLFSLFTLAIGMSSCIPEMNPSKPAQVDPRKIVQNIIDNHVTFAAGSPAIWERVADYCLKETIKLPSIRHLVMFGAPVDVKLHEKYARILLNGTTYTPYGATECLPVSCISGSQILKETKEKTQSGAGTCIGKLAPNVEVKIIAVSDKAISAISEINELEINQIGEIIVKSDAVTPEYYQMPEETNLAKITDENSLWHRMGDLGYFDRDGRLWFCGRKTHLVPVAERILYSDPIESIFNQHQDIRRSALIKVGAKAALAVERVDKRLRLEEEEFKKFIQELKTLAQKNKDAQVIEDFYLRKSFPVDGRHNIKIDRHKLAQLIEASL